MQYGLLLCSHMLNSDPDNNELLFIAITQCNRGGPSVVSDPRLKNTIAKLNLEAGRLSIVSGYTALSLFEHGISYLEDDKWTSQYELTLDLFDAAAEAACVLNKNAAVTSYTEQIVANARCFDDSLNCEYSCSDMCCVWYAIYDEMLTYDTRLCCRNQSIPIQVWLLLQSHSFKWGCFSSQWNLHWIHFLSLESSLYVR